MNKKVNTLLFVLGATVFNIIVAILSWFILMFLFIRFLAPKLSENTGQWAVSLCFLLAIAISFLVYRLVLRYLLTKVDVEKYFDPLFVRKHKAVKRD